MGSKNETARVREVNREMGMREKDGVLNSIDKIEK